ncbi:MAG: hypothetical protein ABSH51_29480 [Solirubrobacteraceae bacterium]
MRKLLLATLAGVLMGYATVGNVIAEVSGHRSPTVVAVHAAGADLAPPGRLAAP